MKTVRASWSAKKLKGKCLILGVFISSKDAPWKPEEKRQTWQNVKRAINWIQKNAIDYDVDLSLDCHCMNMNKDCKVDLPKLRLKYRDILGVVQKTVKFFGNKTITEFYQSTKQLYKGYNIHIMYLVNSVNRSYMHSVWIDDPDKEMEFNVLYREDRTNGIPSGTIAHEILHVYNAFDLYNHSGNKEGKLAEKQATKRFKKEIMLSGLADVYETEMSELTAFFIGWHNDPKPWYSSVIQPKDKELVDFIFQYYNQLDGNGDLIIKTKKIVAKYSYDDGDFLRYRLNDSEDLTMWIQRIKETGEKYEYWESSKDKKDYYLDGISFSTSISIPIKGGTSYIIEDANKDRYYTKWYEMEIIK